MAGTTGYVNAGLEELHKLLTDDDMWISNNNVLDEDKYQKAFPRSSARNRVTRSWTTESSRAVVFIPMNHLKLANMITNDEWDYLFPNMVATDESVLTLSPQESDESPHMKSEVVIKQLHAASPMIAPRKFGVVRKCLQIDQQRGTWIIAEIPFADSAYPYYFHRLPSGCLIQRITDHQSKVTWVEHTEVDSARPDQTSAFAFGAQRIAALLERFCEFSSLLRAAYAYQHRGIGDLNAIQEKLILMVFGDFMVRGLFENIIPIENNWSSSVTGPEDLKVHASVYRSFDESEVAGAIVAFPVKHSPDFVLKTLADGRKHHEWDVLGGCRKLYNLRQYSNGADPRNNVSVSEIEGGDEMLIKEVEANPYESLVVWSTVSKEDFDLISNENEVSDESLLISGFSISTDASTCGSVITLVLRMLVEGNPSSMERGQQAMDSITLAINQTVVRVKEALDKQRPPSPRAERLTDEQSESCKKPKLS